MKTTLRLRADEPGALEQAAALLRKGGLVAFPTETVYGLGALALQTPAVETIFTAKGRPSWDPLIVHVATAAAAAEIASADAVAAPRVQQLAGRFWPGPMTLLLPRTDRVPDAVTAGRSLVGVRMPAHPVARRLLEAVGQPVAAPSANRFGHISPTTAEHVLADLDGRIDAVLDAGACSVGVESTVLDPAQEPMVVYRAGAVTVEQLEEVTGVRARLFVPRQRQVAPGALPSPGVGLRHYAPAVPVHLSGATEAELRLRAELLRAGGYRVGVLLPKGWHLGDDPGEVFHWGVWEDPEALAKRLFAGLRTLEGAGVGAIVCPLPLSGGLRDALRDRLLKAAKPL